MEFPSKEKILATVIEELERELETLLTSALQAKAYATSEESKAENKYDTRGLEASYLAQGQAARAEELKVSLQGLRTTELRDFSKGEAIQATALVQVEIDGEKKSWFFVVPNRGGLSLNVQGFKLQTISPGSPVGRALFGKKPGDFFEIKVGDNVLEYEVVQLI